MTIFGRRRQPPRRRVGRRGGIGARLMIAVVIAGISYCSHLGSRSENPVTGEVRYVDLTPEQEIAVGLASGGARQPEFFSTHPSPGRRIDRIRDATQSQFPNGQPSGLTP